MQKTNVVVVLLLELEATSDHKYLYDGNAILLVW